MGWRGARWRDGGGVEWGGVGELKMAGAVMEAARELEVVMLEGLEV